MINLNWASIIMLTYDGNKGMEKCNIFIMVFKHDWD